MVVVVVVIMVVVVVVVVVVVLLGGEEEGGKEVEELDLEVMREVVTIMVEVMVEVKLWYGQLVPQAIVSRIHVVGDLCALIGWMKLLYFSN